jgi:transcription initiation factor IIE alpha subunit
MLTKLKSKYHQKNMTKIFVTFYCSRCDLKFTYLQAAHDENMLCPLCKIKMKVSTTK